jgi:hypothetical protein
MGERRFAKRFYQYQPIPNVGEEEVDHTNYGGTNSELNLGIRTFYE